MRILFFDTETTGLPKAWNAPMKDLDNWPRIIQLAWMVTDEDGKVLRKQKHLIFPNGWIMPTGDFWIENGYKHETNEVEGCPLAYVLDMFLYDHQYCQVMVSHNMQFDHMVVGAEIYRCHRQAINKPIRICTKERSTVYCKMPKRGGGYKWPKLMELHQFLFQKDFENAHDALADVIALKDCFFELVKREIIVINEKVKM